MTSAAISHTKDQKDLPLALPVGSQILHATGLGYAANYRNSGENSYGLFGDGATSEGDFHEGLNCAAVYQTPVLFICQNDQWAISLPLKQQTRSQTIAQKALAYGMPGIQVDGNDVLAVYSASKEAAECARELGVDLYLAHQEIIIKKYFHIGVAVATEHGLMVPVTRCRYNRKRGRRADLRMGTGNRDGRCGRGYSAQHARTSQPFRVRA